MGAITHTSSRSSGRDLVSCLIQRGALDLAIIDSWGSYFIHANLILFALSFERDFLKVFYLSPYHVFSKLFFYSYAENKRFRFRASLMAQWLRVRLPMQGPQVQALVQEDPTCRGATKPREPQLLSPRATTTEARMPRACALQQEKPPQ